MPTTFFLVRAVVAPHLRDKFDHWHSTDRLLWAIRAVLGGLLSSP